MGGQEAWAYHMLYTGYDAEGELKIAYEKLPENTFARLYQEGALYVLHLVSSSPLEWLEMRDKLPELLDGGTAG